MSSLPVYLQSELTTLSNEARRKYPDIKEACEKVIMIMKVSKDRSPLEIANDLAQTEETLKPILLACSTKLPKLVSIAISCLQKLILHKAVPESSLPQILKILNEVVMGNMEVQLRVLQTVLPLVTNYDGVRGELLNSALLICFKLQESKVAVVNNTAAATLRQLVIVTFDKKITMTAADHVGYTGKDDINEDLQARVSSLSPDAKDAYFLFQDLCYMTNGEMPLLLKLPGLNRTFGLELIESVLTNKAEVFKQYPEFTVLLRERLCPLIIRSFSDKGDFPQTVRVMRIVDIIVKSFHHVLVMECEIFISMLLKLLESDPTLWLRVLASETLRSMCIDIQLIQTIFKQYDLRESQDTKSTLFRDLVAGFNRVVSDNPLNYRSSSGVYQEGGGSGDNGMITKAEAAIRVRCIDQLDRTEPPAIPEGYLLYVALHAIEALISGMFNMTLPDSTLEREAVPSLSNEPLSSQLFTRALASEHELTKQMVSISWTGILASLSFLAKLPLDEPLTLVATLSLNRFCVLCGIYGLASPRDAFIGAMHAASFPHPGSGSDGFGSGGMTSTSIISSGMGSMTPPPTLTKRHIAYLDALLASAYQLSEVLESSWFLVLDAIQNVQHLDLGRGRVGRSDSLGYYREPLSDDDMARLKSNIKRFFESVKYLNDTSFIYFVQALTKLSVESAGSEFNLEMDLKINDTPLISPTSLAARRNQMGKNMFRYEESLFSIEQLRQVCLSTMPRLINQEDHSLWDSVLNHLIVICHAPLTGAGVRAQCSEAIADIIITGMNCASSLRVDSHHRIQLQMLKPLARLMGLPGYIHDHANPQPTVQKSALETLDKLLQNSGHSFTNGWNIVFDILLSACPTQLGASANVVNDVNDTDASPDRARSSIKLVKVAFPCLQLICTDFLAPLPPSCLRDCILTVGRFGCQDEDLNTSLTAIGMLWNVLDFIQKSLDQPPAEYSTHQLIKFDQPILEDDPVTSDVLSRLLLLTLERLATMCSDARPEVRHGAIQTLFRTTTHNGSITPLPVWSTFLWLILFPLLDTVNDIYSIAAQSNTSQPEFSDMMFHHSRNTQQKQWDETRVVLLNGITAVFREFMDILTKIDRFDLAWSNLLVYIAESCIIDSSEVALTAIRSFHKLLTHHSVIARVDKEVLVGMWLKVLDYWVQLGTSLVMNFEPTVTITKLINHFPSDGVDGEVVMALAAPAIASKLLRVKQSVLTTFIECFTPILETLTSARLTISQWHTILQLIYHVVSYSQSDDFCNDTETLSPLQFEVVKLLDSINHNDVEIQLKLLVLEYLPDFSLLSFSGKPLKVPNLSAMNGEIKTGPKYIKLCLTLMERITSSVIELSSDPSLYAQPTLLRNILTMLQVPLELKYRCNDQFTKQVARWKLANQSFCTISTGTLRCILTLAKEDKLEPINYLHYVDAILDTLTKFLAKSPPPSDLSIGQLEADEKAEIETLIRIYKAMIDLSHLETIPDMMITKLISIVREVSVVESLPELKGRPDGDGRDTPFTLLAKERLAFAGLRCLISVCMDPKRRDKLIHDTPNDSDSDDGELPEYRSIFQMDIPIRVAQLAAPVLLNRCIQVLSTFAKEIPVYGRRPLPRVRRDELLFLLRHVVELKLPPNTCAHLLTPSNDQMNLSNSLAASPMAHLFVLYPTLCKILGCRDPAIVGRVALCLERIGQALGLPDAI